MKTMTTTVKVARASGLMTPSCKRWIKPVAREIM